MPYSPNQSHSLSFFCSVYETWQWISQSLWCGFLSFSKPFYQINFSLIVLLPSSILSLLIHAYIASLHRGQANIFIIHLVYLCFFLLSMHVVYSFSNTGFDQGQLQSHFKRHKLSFWIQKKKKFFQLSFEWKYRFFFDIVLL